VLQGHVGITQAQSVALLGSSTGHCMYAELQLKYGVKILLLFNTTQVLVIVLPILSSITQFLLSISNISQFLMSL